MKKGGLNKHSYEYVKEYFEKEGYKLLSNEYNNGNEKLQVICPNGHRWEVRFRAFKSNKCRCPYCSGKGIKFTYDFIKEYIESFGYELKTNKYKNSKTKLLIVCPNKHEFKISWGDFKQGHRCSYCNKKHHYTYNEVKEYVESFGYKLLSKEYTDCKKYIEVSCPLNHRYYVTFDKFKNAGNRCSICNISKGEQKVMEWLNKNNINYIYNFEYFKDLLSPLGNPLRPDFILPDYKIWIEYDGEFHYENRMDKSNYDTLKIHDKIKDEYAKKNGWKLIRIPYWEFDNIEEILRVIL